MATLRDEIPLEPRKILKKSVRRAARALIIGVIVTVVVFLFLNLLKRATIPHLSPFLINHHQMISIVWLIAFALFVFSSPIYEWLYYLRYHYDIDEHNITIRKGVLIQREITLPFHAITDVYIDQDFLDMMLRLYDVHISTPTVESGLFAHIDGVNQRNGVRLKKLVLQHTSRRDEARGEFP